ncbi:MAG: hypothetical protein HZB76_01060 [Chlamydiae bacterium]|nr:hypothetical protein [Chlamydiota bacterium]
MITNIFNNPKVHIVVGTVVAAVSIWAKISAVAMPIFPIIGIIFSALLMINGFNKLQHRPFIFDQVIQDPSKDPLLIQAKKLNMNLTNGELDDEIIKNFQGNSNLTVVSGGTLGHIFFKTDQKSTAPIESRFIEFKTRAGSYKDKDVDCIAAARAFLGSKEEADVNALQKFAKSYYSEMKIYLSKDLNHYQIEAI